jgi:hypothetical protein
VRGRDAEPRHRREWLSGDLQGSANREWKGLVNREDFWVCWVGREMGTARRRRMASLRLGLVECRVWLTALPDRGSLRTSGYGGCRVVASGFALVWSARGRNQRGGGRPATLGLWKKLPSVVLSLGYSSDRLTGLLGGLL